MEGKRSAAAAELGKEHARKKCRRAATKKKVFTIGISGCSSSGKTTIAVLLHEIFLPFLSSSSEDAIPEATSSSLPIVHQDTFFGKKPLCPITAFKSTPAEADFMKASAVANHDNGYYYSYDGQTYIITGPDTDCVEAVDFVWMLKNITTVQDEGSTQNLQYPEKPIDYDREEILRPHAALVEKSRRRIAMWIERNIEDNNRTAVTWKSVPRAGLVAKLAQNLLFAEGFLIFSDPDEVRPSVVNMSDDDYLDKVLEGQSAEVRQRIKDTQREARKDRPARHAARKELMERFDVKLFLPTGKEVAKQRRLSREMYRDPPEGTRKPGEMWKTEGYFNDIVWGGHLKDTLWLGGTLDNKGDLMVGLGNYGKKKGVCVRDERAKSIDATVKWAVDEILKAF